LACSMSKVSPHPRCPSAAAPGAEEARPPRRDPGVRDPASARHRQRADVPNTLKKLIESVEQSFDGYDVDILVIVFITL
jgi:hypothetical protein